MLNADIVINEDLITDDYTLSKTDNLREWVPIRNYKGTFNGNNHTITGIYILEDDYYLNYQSIHAHMMWGMFSYFYGTVKNLALDELYVDCGDIYEQGKGVAGLVGYNAGTIENCSVKGSVKGYDEASLVAAECTSSSKIINSYAIGTVSTTVDNGISGMITYQDREVTNCYYLADSETDSNDGTTAKSADAFASGEVAYLLGEAFGQEIGIDDYPTLGGAKVYQITNCDDETGYRNVNVSGHISEPVEGKEPTCEEDGYTASIKCSVCDKTLTGVEKIPATGHKYENGFCNACDVYQSATLNEENYYEIDNAGKLYWFAQQVNSGKTSINAKLTADIEVNEGEMSAKTDSTKVRNWTPIGNESNRYTGKFYGDDYTISGLYFNNEEATYVGLVGYLSFGGLVDYVGIENSYFNGYEYVGSVVGCNFGTLTNSYNTGTVSGSSWVGGVVGSNNGTLTNSYNTGLVSGGSNYIGGVVGYNYSILTNSYNTGTVSGSSWVGGVVGYNDGSGTITNCYYLNTSCNGGINGADVAGSAEAKTADQFASGEIAYLLQSGVTAEEGEEIPEIWGQKIGTDTYPVLGGDKVYYGYKDCNATEKTYCNNKAYDEIPTHSFENGECTICGDKEPNVSITGDITLVLEEADKDIFTGVVELEAGTYSFNVDDNGTIKGANSTYTNTATISYSADIKTPSKLKATGGKYTFTYNASTKVLKIEYKPAEALGDVNADGNISVSDVIFVMKHIVGDITLDDKQAFLADIDLNGRITLVDALNIQKMILEMA